MPGIPGGNGEKQVGNAHKNFTTGVFKAKAMLQIYEDVLSL